jgi:hypothetical protein
VNRWEEAGSHTLQWAPRGLPRGIYFVRMVAGDVTKVRRIALTY